MSTYNKFAKYLTMMAVMLAATTACEDVDDDGDIFSVQPDGQAIDPDAPGVDEVSPIPLTCYTARLETPALKDGIFIEKMDDKPYELIPEALRKAGEGDAININLDQPIADVCKELSKYPVSTRVNLNGTIIVARDIAHAKIKARLDNGEGMPQYFKDHPVLYAGPAKTPQGMPCGSMGPTTANRMDPYTDEFQENGGSLIMIAKGNRTQVVTDACKKHGGFYLGSIGGPAAFLSSSNIKSIECVEYPELGMEAIWKIRVENFPAFILVDDKGNDFFKQF
jgi:fumarate hydratase class I